MGEWNKAASMLLETCSQLRDLVVAASWACATATCISIRKEARHVGFERARRFPFSVFSFAQLLPTRLLFFFGRPLPVPMPAGAGRPALFRPARLCASGDASLVSTLADSGADVNLNASTRAPATAGRR